MRVKLWVKWIEAWWLQSDALEMAWIFSTQRPKAVNLKEKWCCTHYLSPQYPQCLGRYIFMLIWKILWSWVKYNTEMNSLWEKFSTIWFFLTNLKKKKLIKRKRLCLLQWLLTDWENLFFTRMGSSKRWINNEIVFNGYTILGQR